MLPKSPILLDLYCCQGGAAAGYQRAGFYVIGVDKDPQPNYCGDDFIQADALEVLRYLTHYGVSRWHEAKMTDLHLALSQYPPVEAVHASPPCQFATVYGNNKAHVKDDHPNLIPATRELLKATGLPYVIENVEGAQSHLVNPVRVCGTGLDWCRVRRHRYFEANWPIKGATCNHSRYFLRFFPGSSNRPNGRTVMNVGEYRVPLRLQRKVMKMPWADLDGISQAVPPAYTEHIGWQLRQYLEAVSEMAA